MTSKRPYLLRALYEWVLENQCTPHVLIDANVPGVQVPPSTVKDGQVVFNLAPHAIAHLEMGNDILSFHARFAGVSQRIRVPIGAVIAIYARENGEGMMFPPESTEMVELEEEALDSVEVAEESVAPRSRAHLKVIK
ncbi:MAG: ClpXP protease specificity-enhancing factor [Xanthomonadales bacterium]|nr:ClpXP protease specificity-enhancing factor [Xanthomonadales bacterium]